MYCRATHFVVSMRRIEVFKTNVTLSKDAKTIVEALARAGQGQKANFDLEDCDKILRVQFSDVRDINIEKILDIVKEANFEIEILE